MYRHCLTKPVFVDLLSEQFQSLGLFLGIIIIILIIIIIIEYLSRIYNPSVPSTVINGVLLTKKIKNLINKNKQKNISKENMH